MKQWILSLSTSTYLIAWLSEKNILPGTKKCSSDDAPEINPK